MALPKIKVIKYSATMPVSCCMLTDATGENHCDHPPPPREPWLRRARWELAAWWYDNRPRIHRGPCNHDDCS